MNALLRLTAETGVYGRGHGCVCVAHNIQRDCPPLRVERLGNSDQSIIVGFISDLRVVVPRTAFTTTAACDSGSRASQTKQQRIGPVERHDDPGKDDNQQWERAPDSENVVPIPIASSSSQSTAKGDRRAESFPTPFARQPENHAEEDQRAKEEVRYGRQPMADALRPKWRAQCAMQSFHCGEEIMRGRRAGAEDSAAVGVDVDGLSAADRKLRGRLRLITDNDCCGVAHSRAANGVKQIGRMPQLGITGQL